MNAQSHLIAAVTDTVAAAAVGESGTFTIDTVTVEISGHSRVNFERPTPGAAFTLACPGAEPVTLSPDTWAELAAEIDRLDTDHCDDVRQLTQDMMDEHKRIARLERDLTKARNARAAAMRGLSSRAVTNYKLAKKLEMSQPAVAKIIGK